MKTFTKKELESRRAELLEEKGRDPKTRKPLAEPDEAKAPPPSGTASVESPKVVSGKA